MAEKKPVIVAGNNMSTKAKNPSTLIQAALTIFLPILAYLQMEPTDFTNWNSVVQFFMTIVKNPILFFMMINGLWATFTDPNVKTWWADNVINRNKVEPTKPDDEVEFIGEKKVDEESKVIVDNTENNYGPEVYSNGKRTDNEV